MDVIKKNNIAMGFIWNIKIQMKNVVFYIANTHYSSSKVSQTELFR